MEVELCDFRLKLKENADLAVRYLYNPRHQNRKGSVIRELYDAKRSTRIDNVIAFVNDEHEALTRVRRDIRRLVHKRFAELEARTALDKSEEQLQG